MRGVNQITWDGTDKSGKDCKPGVYIVKLTMNEIQYSYKIIHY
jgi:flagellar hook assembly protein FlgD